MEILWNCQRHQITRKFCQYFHWKGRVPFDIPSWINCLWELVMPKIGNKTYIPTTQTYVFLVVTYPQCFGLVSIVQGPSLIGDTLEQTAGTTNPPCNQQLFQWYLLLNCFLVNSFSNFVNIFRNMYFRNCFFVGIRLKTKALVVSLWGPVCRWELPTDDKDYEKGRMERMKGAAGLSEAICRVWMGHHDKFTHTCWIPRLCVGLVGVETRKKSLMSGAHHSMIWGCCV